jgi:hypothetical protein
VSILDGKYVFVRGLGERDTMASRNGARVPSREPDGIVVPVDTFPSNLRSGIQTSKTFTPDRPGGEWIADGASLQRGRRQ